MARRRSPTACSFVVLVAAIAFLLGDFFETFDAGNVHLRKTAAIGVTT